MLRAGCARSPRGSYQRELGAHGETPPPAQLFSNDLLRLLVRNLGETPLWSKDQLLGQIRERAQQTEGMLLVLLDEAHLLKGS